MHSRRICLGTNIVCLGKKLERLTLPFFLTLIESRQCYPVPRTSSQLSQPHDHFRRDQSQAVSTLQKAQRQGTTDKQLCQPFLCFSQLMWSSLQFPSGKFHNMKRLFACCRSNLGYWTERITTADKDGTPWVGQQNNSLPFTLPSNKVLQPRPISKCTERNISGVEELDQLRLMIQLSFLRNVEWNPRAKSVIHKLANTLSDCWLKV